jgi:hypothetical protein
MTGAGIGFQGRRSRTTGAAVTSLTRSLCRPVPVLANTARNWVRTVDMDTPSATA